ncbi:hypothetical protein DFP72DRAFT_1077902 [Ephemerocybe angulata]|uniref:26S proteasome complex subunit SEM1 n=1 Tax=Ephemerocybe angulata TaxID=980116 RepID=A0A8H6HDK3_9AGAR|nr:hypothetical protein DFP72DRAFT_1077902 [Tulosesus angulatus]
MDLAHLGGAPRGAAKSTGDKLWKYNWDDDDIEDDFTMQLRCIGIDAALTGRVLTNPWFTDPVDVASLITAIDELIASIKNVPSSPTTRRPSRGMWTAPPAVG